MKDKKKRIIRNQKGFTLIEIIAVLIILGVLAAVAVPKFVDLTTEARKKSLDGAIAAGMSQVSMDFAKLLLTNNGSEPTMEELAAEATNDDLGGDFKYTFTDDGTTGIKIQVQAVDENNSPVGESIESIWTKP